MDALFAGEPAPLPSQSGPTWTVSFPPTPEPAPVRHASGYEPFVALAEAFGTDPRSLFDLWAFAHFVRAHREALEADPDLLRAAVLFLGNTLIASAPECFWSNRTNGPAVESDRGELVEIDSGRFEFEHQDTWRYLGVGGTVPAVLDADEARFREFSSVVERWPTGAIR